MVEVFRKPHLDQYAYHIHKTRDFAPSAESIEKGISVASVDNYYVIEIKNNWIFMEQKTRIGFLAAKNIPAERK